MSPLLRIPRPGLFILGLASLIWLFLRTGLRPTRATYPCQQASAAAASLWLTVYALPLMAALRTGKVPLVAAGGLFSLILLLAGAFLALDPGGGSPGKVALILEETRSDDTEASDIFAVQGTRGDDGGVKALIDIMEVGGLPFYDRGEGGVVAADDLVLIKVNSQWDERGGTSTDLVKALIRAVLDHPDGFSGEVVIADNGQGQFGSTGHGGSLDYMKNNAADEGQSMEDVAASFEGRVSTYLWDKITTRRVLEYSKGDDGDGYILADEPDPETGLIVSYPKFTTPLGTRVSFRLGVWDPEVKRYDSDRLSVINVPVLKSHSIYGVTGAVKHYMGVVSEKLTSREGRSSHAAVSRGGMGTELVETRFPALSVLDAIWVNARPGSGPGTSYDEASYAGVVAASTDPVALDSWGAREILIPAARARGYGDVSSMDPEGETFGRWLGLAAEEIKRAGLKANAREDGVNVHVAALAGEG